MEKTVGTDFKSPARKVASRSEWEAIVAEKMGPCRVSGDMTNIDMAHLVSRAQRGDDVPANIIPLRHDLHMILHDHSAGWEEIASAVRHSLTPIERQYVSAKKGKWYLDRNYPHADTGLCARCKKPKAAARTPEQRRNRKRVVVTVPDDAENGAQILDVLVESCRDELKEPLGYRDDTPAYYIYTAVLADWLSSRAA